MQPLLSAPTVPSVITAFILPARVERGATCVSCTRVHARGTTARRHLNIILVATDSFAVNGFTTAAATIYTISAAIGGTATATVATATIDTAAPITTATVVGLHEWRGRVEPLCN